QRPNVRIHCVCRISLPRSGSSVVDALFAGDVAPLCKRLTDGLAIMQTTDFGPSGINEAGFKAMIIVILRSDDPSVDIVSEQATTKANDVFYADLVIKRKQITVLLELKSIGSCYIGAYQTIDAKTTAKDVRARYYLRV